MKNFLAGLLKGNAKADDLSAELDQIASLDSKPSFGNGATIRELMQALHGVDVRKLWMDGYSDKQIRRLLMDEYDLMELYKKEPDGNNRTVKGKEILANKKQVTK